MTTVQQSSTVSDALMATMNPKAATTSTSSVDDAQNRFLKLLVTQMENQDPLNPMDNSQVTSQFAQLSTVTGIDKLNDTVTALQSNYQASQSLQAASMIGHSVLAPGSSVSLSGGKAVMGVDLANSADSVQMVVRDSSGKAVHTVNLGSQKAGVVPLVWDGSTDTGGPATDGTYTFEVNATSAGQKVDATALSFGEVGSVTTGSQGVTLNVSGMGTVKLTDVRQIL
jgi:flagellar basal-body rod modification protein FlgD